MRSFLMVSQQGSLSAAAKVLGVSQPTLSRNIQALEHETRLQLFQRSTQGLLLTEAGHKLVDAAEQMAAASDLFHRQASGLSTELEGDIRISASEVIGVYALPPALAAFREQHPKVQIELDISNQTTSLSKRDADIALRMYRPSQPDLVARHLADIALGFFASTAYIKKHGHPRRVEDMQQHSMIGFDKSMEFIDQAARQGFNCSAQDFDMRSDNILAQFSLARAGAGIAVMHVDQAEQWGDMHRVLEDMPIPNMELWIVCHQDTQYNSRIRALTHFLSEWLS